MEQANALYRTLWRWHFYAALYVLPFIIILSLTGAIFLFKPQINRWEERAFQNLPTTNAVSPNVQLDAARAAFPDAQFDSYRLPERPGDAAMIHLGLADGQTMRDVFVSPQGKVLGSFDPETRIAEIVSKIHGALYAGRIGSWLVELAACWAIVMILTGLYLWWPKSHRGGRSLAGILWPRLSLGKRAFWRDIHAVTGFWVSGLALVLLVTGLPWASVWGEAFKIARTELGLIQGKQDWTMGGKAADGDETGHHDHAAMMRMQTANVPMASLATIVDMAQREKLAFPTWVKAPSAMAWTVKSEAQNRTLRATITYDMATGEALARENFADRHPIDRAIGYGIAWHEGQLFGWFNQLIGVLTALALMLMAMSGFIMWWRRKPQGSLGAPPASHVRPKRTGLVVIIAILALLLPLLAASLLAMWVIDYAVLRVRRWLGMHDLAV
jgi:uncharacterized iron-regulated membrane protein